MKDMMDVMIDASAFVLEALTIEIPSSICFQGLNWEFIPEIPTRCSSATRSMTFGSFEHLWYIIYYFSGFIIILICLLLWSQNLPIASNKVIASTVERLGGLETSCREWPQLAVAGKLWMTS
ncbi:hypothetical protein PM082_016669 [Marasmius tenuissimus]|nr:hypothetical protein PM082_016669 [Marasmius tenuissimus]